MNTETLINNIARQFLDNHEIGIPVNVNTLHLRFTNI